MAKPRPSSSETDPTPGCLLAAAGEIFARRGYEAATVAEITRAAGANVASVNYHFGDKLTLYLAVLRHALPPPPAAPAPLRPLTPAQELREFIFEFVRALIGEGRPSWGARIMAREIAQPTAALPEVIDDMIRPRYERLRDIVGTYLGERPTSERVRLVAHSVIAQCVHWAHAQPLFPHLWPQLRLSAAQVDRIAEHIAKFSLAGLKAMRQRPVKP